MIEYTVEVHPNGSKKWFLNDQLHREDGPAIEDADGYKAWFMYGKRVTEADVMKPTKELTIAEAADEIERLQKINAKLDSNFEVVIRHLQAAHRMLMRHNIPCGSSDYIGESK